MNFDDMRRAVQEAKNTLANADSMTGAMAEIIVGRLRTANVPGWTLEKLKRELRDYNIHTNRWKK